MERAYYGVDLRVTVRPVEVRDGVAAVWIDYAVQGDADVDRGRRHLIGLAVSGAEASFTHAVRLVEEGRVMPVASTRDGLASAVDSGSFRSGEPRTGVSLHAAPSGESVGVLIPIVGFVADVPVREAGEVFDDVVGQVGEPADASAYELRSYVVGERSAASVEGETSTVTLRSDVLFGSDESALSAQADAALAEAAERIKAAAAGGEVSVVGHTDDVDTEEYNQGLSQRRAASVADRLGGLLGGQYTISAEGRGESEPVAEGTSPEARAANRRVEVAFTGRISVESGVEGELVQTAAPTSSGLDPVTYVARSVGTSYTARVVEVVRTDVGLVGTLRIASDPGDKFPIDSMGGRGSGPAHERGFRAVPRVTGAHSLSLLTPGERVMPWDYEVPDGVGLAQGRRLLGDEVEPFASGPGFLATVVWPDTGQDTVTIDVPDWFRITDVPVTEPR
ncbi:OmpA family protein [Xylanimonas ulmi]|uniref:Outer membrane protein OmpA-like peptidoglycan-associated protein n=1 Tax=Xylanimonas ulmi TaxID=228973 RepID=A0A4Q7MA36_9MICO|nr:OmpA family protein [Xylanibacterium ulmi]RZS63089.1 outer membrane protein OmpA-like peptidoglycan-associated protein [Xylanibacterium ulmi]